MTNDNFPVLVSSAGGRGAGEVDAVVRMGTVWPLHSK